MLKNYEIKQYDGKHPAMYMHVAEYAMDPKIIREFDGYPILSDENYQWFLVFDKDKMIAFASIKIFSNKVKFISTYVLPEYRRKGIHAELIKQRLDWCRKSGYKIIEADALNTSLNQLKKAGFKEIKTYAKWHKLLLEL